MADLTRLNADLNVIAKLDDEPNDVGGLTAAELKGAFDRAGNTIKTYLNETLLPETEKGLAACDTALSAHKVQLAAKADKAALDSHTGSTANPHHVTAAQAGADPAGTAASAVSGHDASATAHEAQFAAKADKTALDGHTGSTANPHHVTAAQAGADPAGTAASAVSGHDASATAHKTQFAAKADKTAVDGHIGSTANPHHVTAAQVRADPAGTAARILADHDGDYNAHEAQFAEKADWMSLDDHVGDTANPHRVTAAQVHADPAGAAASAVSGHDAAATAHKTQFAAKADKTALDALAAQKQDKLTGKAGQLVGFNAAGEAVAVAAPAPRMLTAAARTERVDGGLRTIGLEAVFPDDTLVLDRRLTAAEQAALDALAENETAVVFVDHVSQAPAFSSWWFLRRSRNSFRLWRIGGTGAAFRPCLTLDGGTLRYQVDTAYSGPLREGSVVLDAPTARYYARSGTDGEPTWVRFSGAGTDCGGWTALGAFRDVLPDGETDPSGPCWAAQVDGYEVLVTRDAARPYLRIRKRA